MATFDIASLAPVAAAALLGGGVTLFADRARTRSADKEKGRTAARLVYAELVRNSAPVRYYLRTQSLLVHTVTHTAWDTHGEALAKIGAADDFYMIYNGYAAMEAFAFLSTQDGLIERYDDDFLDKWVEDLRGALAAAGRIAEIDRKRLDDETQGLTVAGSPLSVEMSNAAIGLMPWYLIRAIESGLGAPSDGPTSVDTDIRTLDPTIRRGRTIYNAGNARVQVHAEIPVARKEGDPPTGDPAVDETYDGIGWTHEFFWRIYGRSSLDGVGGPIHAVVHYGDSYGNIFWDGFRLVMGDGDDSFINRPWAYLDVIAAELTKAIIQYGVGFIYSSQSGALTQSLSDVFGQLVKQYKLGQSATEADWIVGKGILGSSVNGSGLRSMAEPGTAFEFDPQPGHMDDYADLPDDNDPRNDNGGVHINSGIPNRAFYCVATSLRGHAWEGAGRIWYETLSDSEIGPRSDFPMFAAATVRSASRLFGESSRECEAVVNGWRQVGVEPL